MAATMTLSSKEMWELMSSGMGVRVMGAAFSSSPTGSGDTCNPLKAKTKAGTDPNDKQAMENERFFVVTILMMIGYLFICLWHLLGYCKRWEQVSLEPQSEDVEAHIISVAPYISDPSHPHLSLIHEEDVRPPPEIHDNVMVDKFLVLDRGASKKRKNHKDRKTECFFCAIANNRLLIRGVAMEPEKDGIFIVTITIFVAYLFVWSGTFCAIATMENERFFVVTILMLVAYLFICLWHLWRFCKLVAPDRGNGVTTTKRIPKRKDLKMEKKLQDKNQGEVCSKVPETNENGGHTPLLPAQRPNDGNWQSPPMPSTSKLDHSEYSLTPVPWSKHNFSHKPIAGEGRKLSFTTSIKQSDRLAAASVKSGDHQVQKAEDIAKVKKAKALHLGHPDKVKALDVLEDFIVHFLAYLHECPDRPDFKDTRELIPGDNYAYEEFLGPGEFEVLLTIPLPDYTQYVEIEGYRGLFYTLSLLKKPHAFPPTFLLEDEKTISPRNVTEEFWKQVNTFIDTSVPFPGWQVRLGKKKHNSPVFNLVVLDDGGTMYMIANLVLLLEFTGQWPGTKQARELMEDNLVTDLTEKFYFIAELTPGRYSKATWRISFSHMEKEILYHHSNPPACYRHHGSKCCRNDCLQMLQDLADYLKKKHPLMLSPLSPYHIQTSFLHTLWKWKADTEWKPSDVAHCFKRALGNFTQEVASGHLSHFFLPTCNLFTAKLFPPTKLKFLCSHLREKETTTKTSHKKSYPALAGRPDMTRPLQAAFSCSP
ncbi:cyclic GMP-AMP synthase [Erythrolamprus reginae]|uniref:cyclic GMP-AMP synthase n=1 Tax=Erythrolamprus reginae TaxID=121349 RepID=UPI00396CDF10